MGRELRRKQAKKEGKSLINSSLSDENQLKKLIIITIIVIAVLGTVYLMSALFITKELDWFNNNGTSDGDTDKVTNSILASSIFKQSDEEYYVYFYDFTEKENIITDIVTQSQKINKVYKVNTASAMNANYVGEKGNKAAKKLEDIVVVSPTLIKLVGDEIVEYYEQDEIKDYLS